MGSGSTIAAAEALGLCSLGIERYADYFNACENVIPQLTGIVVEAESNQPQLLNLSNLYSTAPQPRARSEKDMAQNRSRGYNQT